MTQSKMLSDEERRRIRQDIQRHVESIRLAAAGGGYSSKSVGDAVDGIMTVIDHLTTPAEPIPVQDAEVAEIERDLQPRVIFPPEVLDVEYKPDPTAYQDRPYKFKGAKYLGFTTREDFNEAVSLLQIHQAKEIERLRNIGFDLVKKLRASYSPATIDRKAIARKLNDVVGQSTDDPVGYIAADALLAAGLLAGGHLPADAQKRLFKVLYDEDMFDGSVLGREWAENLSKKMVAALQSPAAEGEV